MEGGVGDKQWPEGILLVAGRVPLSQRVFISIGDKNRYLLPRLLMQTGTTLLESKLTPKCVYHLVLKTQSKEIALNIEKAFYPKMFVIMPNAAICLAPQGSHEACGASLGPSVQRARFQDDVEIWL